MSKTDIQLKQDVEEELRWDPRINAAHVGVRVENGAVSLLGVVNSYAQKWAAEEAVKRVSGVRAVAADLTIKILTDQRRSDSDLANAIRVALAWDVFVPDTVSVKVEGGWVTLEGQVGWNYQRESAERAMRFLTGVTGLTDKIALKPEVSAARVKEKIECALQRQATADANSIRIDTAGSQVTLSGRASSWQSIEDAANAAWAVPGVTEVIDQVKMSMTF